MTTIVSDTMTPVYYYKALISLLICLIMLWHITPLFPKTKPSLTTSTPATPTPANAAPTKLTKDTCEAAYGRRRFLVKREERVPPLLYSFPGKPGPFVRQGPY